MSKMHALILKSAMALSIMALTGCSYLQPYKAPLTQGNAMTEESVNLLQEGLTKKQVRELLGPPTGKHPFKPNHWEYIYYSTQNNSKTLEHTKYLVVLFDEDELLSQWEEKSHQVDLKKNDSWLGLGWI